MSAPNVLLVVLDSVRARNCSLYGHDNETTPFLSRFAEESARFDQARSPSIHSVASHASIWTGLATEEHGITEHKSFVKPERTVWHRLATEGSYETGIFTPNVIIAQTSNLADVFDTFVGPKRAQFRLFDNGLAPLDVEGDLSTSEYIRAAFGHDAPVRSLLNGAYKKFEKRGGSHDPATENGPVYVKEFLDWMDDCTGPWAACLNLMDAHTPFVPDPEYDKWSDEPSRKASEREKTGEKPDRFTEEFWDYLEALLPLYEGTIRQADAAVELLIDALVKRDVLEQTLVVVTSDHGEGFGETNELDPGVRLRHHSWGIDEVLTHVPLVVRPPGAGDDRIVREPASLTQFPTVVDALLEGDDPVAAFVPERDVLSSTYRIEPPGDELDLPPAEREKYFGPWRAVYRQIDGNVVKYTRRGDDAATLVVHDAQTIDRRTDGDEGVVEDVFGNLEDVEVRYGDSSDRDMEDDVESRLEDLGYLR